MADSTASASMTLDAPAKVNLFLEIIGRREDGYHDIESIFQTVSLYDRLTLTLAPGSGVELSCDVKDLENPENLAFKAAKAFLDAASVPRRAHIRLEKRIPAQAGLGGGSSDAAAVLVAANNLSGRPLDNDSLRSLAASLGSDVPFFIEGGSAIVTGRGENVRHFDPPAPFFFVILFPGFGVSTAAVYKNLTLKLTHKPKNAKVLWELMSGGNLDEADTRVYNRLEETAYRLDDRLLEITLSMQRVVGSKVTMCGSGASLFSLFADRHRALQAYEALKATVDGEVFFAESISRRGFSERPKGVGGGDF